MRLQTFVSICQRNRHCGCLPSVLTRIDPHRKKAAPADNAFGSTISRRPVRPARGHRVWGANLDAAEHEKKHRQKRAENNQTVCNLNENRWLVFSEYRHNPATTNRSRYVVAGDVLALLPAKS
jgi:hypothetical protein